MDINTPPLNNPLPVVGSGAAWTPPWRNWFTQVWQVVFAAAQSGTTANRPTSNLWAGRTYFDTTLGQPIWVNAAGTGWVDATGAGV